MSNPLFIKAPCKPRQMIQIVRRGFCLFLLSFLLLSRAVFADTAPFPFYSYLSKYGFDSIAVPMALQVGGPVVKLHHDQVPQWKTMWDSAREKARSGDLATAVSLYDKMLALKDIQEARWELAVILTRLGQNKKAYAHMGLLNERESGRDDYRIGLAALSVRLGHFDRSAQLFGDLVKHGPKRKKVLAGAAYSLLALADRSAAMPLLEELILKDPDNMQLRKALAHMAFDLKQDKIALRHFRALADQADDNKEYTYKLALLHERLGDRAKAVEFWQKLYVFDKNDLDVNTKLAEYYQESGKVADALPYLKAILKHKPDNAKILKDIGQCYIGMQDFAQALEYFSRYLVLQPYDKDAVRFVANIHAALGHKEETLKALEHYFSIEPAPDAAKLKKAAQLYDEKGLYHEAISLYRRILSLSPDDPEILVSLAKSFLEIGDDEDALKVWKKLAELAPGVVEVYRPMVGLLERLGRESELVPVLEVIHELDPDDQSVILRLIEKYFALGNFERCGNLINKVVLSNPLPKDFYLWQGTINFQQNLLTRAIEDFERYLQDHPHKVEVRLHCLTAAGRQGDLHRVVTHLRVVEEAGISLDDQQQLLVAQALHTAGAIPSAINRYQRIFESRLRDITFAKIKRLPATDVGTSAVLGLSECYQQQGLIYEAEQALRVGLVTTDQLVILPRLIDLALRRGRVDEAEEWLHRYKEVHVPERISFLLGKMRVLVAQGEMWSAQRLIRKVLRKLAANAGQESLISLQEKIDFAHFLATIGQYEESEKLLRSVLHTDPAQSEAMIMLESIGWLTGNSDNVHLDLATLEPWQLLNLVFLYDKHENYPLVEKSARLLLEKIPGAFQAQLMIAKALRKQGDLAGALLQFADLHAKFPDNHAIRAQHQKLVLDAGVPDQLANLAANFVKPQKPHERMLFARTLWRQNKLNESIDQYRGMLDPGVGTLLRKAAENHRILLPKIKGERSFWEKIGLTPAEDSGLALAGHVMSPSFFLDLIDKGHADFAMAVAERFALYQWQEQAASELRIRHLVKNREFVQAEKSIESFLVRYPFERVWLYDLAGIYKRLGKFGEEAGVYEELLADHPESKELRNALARNQMRLEPKVTLTAGFNKEEGRNDYKDVEKNWQQVSFWFAPKTRHEARVHLTRNNYRSIARDHIVRSSKAYASYKTNWSGLSLRFGGGVESLDKGGAAAALFDVETEGKLGDRLIGTLRFNRDVVADTTASLSRELIQQNFRAAVAVAPLTRLSLGGAYEVKDYSDNNWTTGYDLWSSYTLFPEPTFLKAYYAYDFKESREGRESSGPMLGDGFTIDDHPYWSPKNYWSNRFGAYFKHDLSPGMVGPDIPKYYSIEYALSHDSDGYAMQLFTGGFHVEIAPALTIDVAAEIVSSPSYRKKGVQLSASYRW